MRDAGEEISDLIATLVATDQRLEELTAGEVDSVAHRDGRTFLLQRAQDRMRLSDAAKQSAILNALPTLIALLDAQGLIISVNEAWRESAGENALQRQGYGLGLNYLAICDAARGADSAEGRDAATGIRAVLGGRSRIFSLEYPCHSPTEQRWFLMTVTPLNDDHPTGAVVMHLNITASKRAEKELRKSEAEFRTLAESMPQIVWIMRADGGNIYFNQQWTDYTGLTLEESLGSGWIRPFHPDDKERAWDAWQRAMATSGVYSIESRLRRADGAYRWWLVRGMPLLDAGGNILKWFGTCTDIHDLKVAELEISRANRELRRNEVRIRYMNRVYAMMSSINTLIGLVRDRDELFREACRIAVEQGGFTMALIGMLDRRTMSVVPVASTGVNEGLMIAIKALLSDPDSAPKTMIARAIREKMPVVSNDSQRDPRALLGKQQGEAGVRSCVVLPLIVAGEAVGVLILYAGEIEFFHEEEMKVLTELAADIAFAIDHIEKGEKLSYLAYYDPLTGLANRSLFLERVARHMQSAASAGHKLALFLFDLERFKSINDSLGRPAGDALLRLVAEWLTQNLGDASQFARVDADHFAIVLPDVEQDTDVVRLVESKMKSFLEHPFLLNEAVFRIAAKVGAAVFPDDGSSADSLFINAEAALKKAKARGERYLFYTLAMTETVAGTLTLENQLRQALDKDEFELHYQPKVNLVSGELTGAEALIRWKDPLTGLVPPGRFIPILEQTGLIYEVGRWALRQAVADYLRWRAAGLAAMRIAVNVSPLQLRNRGFVAEIEQAIGVDAQAAAGLELEITESLIMEDVKHNIASLQAIRALGVTIAIDDFGTGFSSLAYLARLPVDTLKIDRSFVTDMTTGPEGLALVSTIINLAHSLKLNAVAEGVETEEQSRLLRLLHCDEMQGFLFSKPLPAATYESRYLSLNSETRVTANSQH